MAAIVGVDNITLPGEALLRDHRQRAESISAQALLPALPFHTPNEVSRHAHGQPHKALHTRARDMWRLN